MRCIGNKNIPVVAEFGTRCQAVRELSAAVCETILVRQGDKQLVCDIEVRLLEVAYEQSGSA